MPEFINQQLLKHSLDRKLVVFAGAGISMGKPANMPGWYGLNDALLEALWNKIQKEYRISNVIREEFISQLTTARERNAFPPDYQAQIMEDQVGMDYFNSLSAVDSSLFNPGHDYLAQLAGTGAVRAVVTTNFDTMLEQAMEFRKVDYKSFFEEEGFDHLSKELSERTINYVPIIKVHGTAAAPSSMVDTLKQRLKGRSQALNKLLAIFLQQYYFLFSGFSGADLDFDPGYLGLRAAAAASPGFTYAYRPGSTIGKAIADLMKVYEGKSEAIQASADELFRGLVNSMNITSQDFSLPQNEHKPVSENLREWADALAPMKAVNMIYALAESLGVEAAARFLLDRVWKNRLPKDYEDETYARFLNNLGKSYLFNFQTREERADIEGVYIITQSFFTSEDKNDLANAAVDNFGKLAIHNKVNVDTPIGFTLFGLMKAFEGNPTPLSSFPRGFFDHPVNPTNLQGADMVYYYSFYADMVCEYQLQAKLLGYGIEWAVADHDWPREGFLKARLALLAARINQFESARQLLERVFYIADKLNDSNMLGEALLAKGVCERKDGAYNEAIHSLKRARQIFKTKIRKPQLIMTNIELLWCILNIPNDASPELAEELTELWKEISAETDPMVVDRMGGFEPMYCYIEGWLFYTFASNGRKKALAYLTDAYNRAIACAQENVAERFKKQYIEEGIWNEIEAILQEIRALEKSAGSEFD